MRLKPALKPVYNSLKTNVNISNFRVYIELPFLEFLSKVQDKFAYTYGPLCYNTKLSTWANRHLVSGFEWAAM